MQQVQTKTESSNPYADERDCSKCGNRKERIDCDTCGGRGGWDADDLMEEDPLWYCGVDWEGCGDCNEKGWYLYCFSCKN